MKPVLLLAAAFALAGCSSLPEAPSTGASASSQPAEPAAASIVRITPAAQKESGIVVRTAAARSVPQVLRATARITNDENRTWRVGAITDGRVIRVYANQGDKVTQGQVLARLHSHDIHDGRADYRRAVSELGRAQASEAYAVRVRDRAKRLYELKAASAQEVEHAETELRNAQTAVANARTEVDRTLHHLVEFLGVLPDPAEHPAGEQDADADLIPVKAPSDGDVLARNITPGTVVTPSMDLFIISDLTRLWAIAEVNEEHLSKLRAGMLVKLYTQAYGTRPFPGRIGKIGEALDPQTHTVKVRVDVPNYGGALKPEMYATAEIALGASAPAIFAPSEAVQEVRGGAVVFVEAAPGRFEARPVQLGRTGDGEVELIAGVKPGERIAVSGAFILKSEFLKASLAEE
jgi:cobalt-zinc-cadmium efflux system membrane fusion protein